MRGRGGEGEEEKEKEKGEGDEKGLKSIEILAKILSVPRHIYKYMSLNRNTHLCVYIVRLHKSIKW